MTPGRDEAPSTPRTSSAGRSSTGRDGQLPQRLCRLAALGGSEGIAAGPRLAKATLSTKGGRTPRTPASTTEPVRQWRAPGSAPRAQNPTHLPASSGVVGRRGIGPAESYTADLRSRPDRPTASGSVRVSCSERAPGGGREWSGVRPGPARMLPSCATSPALPTGCRTRLGGVVERPVADRRAGRHRPRWAAGSSRTRGPGPRARGTGEGHRWLIGPNHRHRTPGTRASHPRSQEQAAVPLAAEVSSPTISSRTSQFARARAWPRTRRPTGR